MNLYLVFVGIDAMTLQAKLRSALSKATAQSPVETKVLYALGTHKNVVAALLAMQDAREVGCCEITTKGVKRVVWWTTGIVQPSISHFQTRAVKLKAKKAAQMEEWL